MGLDRPRRRPEPAEVAPLPVELDLATVVALHQRSHDRRATRLGVAWRLSLALWAALLLAAGFGFDSSTVASTLQDSRWIVTAIGAALVVLVVLHGWYLSTVAASADADRSYAVTLEQLAGVVVGAPATAAPSSSGLASRCLQVWVTAVLASGVVLAAATAAPSLPCTTVTQAAPGGSTTTITCPSPAAGT
jgi:hypothetical protein